MNDEDIIVLVPDAWTATDPDEPLDPRLQALITSIEASGEGWLFIDFGEGVVDYPNSNYLMAELHFTPLKD